MAAAGDLKERRRERRVREILEAAMRVFAEKGYPKATMEEIAERALLSRVALYKYFHDKEAILKALLEWKIEELAARLAEAGSGPYPEAIRALAQSGVRFQEENQGFFRALYTATGLPGLLRDPALRRQKERLVESVARVIAAGQRSGRARGGDPRLLAELFLNLLFSVTVHDFFEPDRPAYDPEPIAEVFLRGTLVP